METTIIPFNNLPDCAANCGQLYDANGACVPPALPEVDNSCFCDFQALRPFHSDAATNVCPEAGCDAAGLGSIQAWYTSYCSSATGGSGASQSDASSASGSGSATGSRATGSASQNEGPGGDWISNHWQWVVGIVIMIVGIAGIWIGACIWRRRYLKRKDRMNHFGKHTSQSAFPAPGGSAVHVGMPGANGPAPGGPTTSQVAGPGVFMPGSSQDVAQEQPKKKKWIVRERT